MIALSMTKSFIIFAGAFVTAQGSEATPCFHLPIIPGFNQPEICNLTSENGSPWYCGHPLKRWLTCQDYQSTRIIYTRSPNLLTPTEEGLLRQEKQFHYIHKPHKIVLKVKSAETTDGHTMTKLLPTTPCHSLPARRTWEMDEPTGYFNNTEWIPLHCRLPSEIDQGCWRNLEVVMYGDSNAREEFYDIATASHCKQLIKQTTEKWHQRLKCVNETNNFVLRWEPHKNPFHSSSAIFNQIQVQGSASSVHRPADPIQVLHKILIDLVCSEKQNYLVMDKEVEQMITNKQKTIKTKKTWAHKNWTTSTSGDLDIIPSHGRYLVFFNHYLHLSASHISAFVGMLTSIRDSLTRLLDRNPQVLAVLQGPHIVWWLGNKTPYYKGDNLNRFFISLQRELFTPLRDRLFYLPTSDLTIASVNQAIHPPYRQRRQISRLLHGLVCGRKS